jgi:hypothetical protein
MTRGAREVRDYIRACADRRLDRDCMRVEAGGASWLDKAKLGSCLRAVSTRPLPAHRNPASQKTRLLTLTKVLTARMTSSGWVLA